jgi:hypothetical protein
MTEWLIEWRDEWLTEWMNGWQNKWVTEQMRSMLSGTLLVRTFPSNSFRCKTSLLIVQIWFIHVSSQCHSQMTSCRARALCNCQQQDHRLEFDAAGHRSTGSRRKGARGKVRVFLVHSEPSPVGVDYFTQTEDEHSNLRTFAQVNFVDGTAIDNHLR